MEPEFRSVSVPKPVVRRVFIPENRKRLVEILGECTKTGRVPTTQDILALLDVEYPAHGKFAESYEDLHAAGIHDALDIARWEVCFLTTLGKLGRDGARILRKYTQDKILIPLNLLETRSKSIEGIDELTDSQGFEAGEVSEIEDPGEVEVKMEDVEEESGGESSGIEEIEGW